MAALRILDHNICSSIEASAVYSYVHHPPSSTVPKPTKNAGSILGSLIPREPLWAALNYDSPDFEVGL